MFQIPSANALVDFIKEFTGSTNTEEIKDCIFLAELSMRNIELPALRSDPFDPQYIGVVDAQGGIPIPGDMNKPILFFKQGVQYITTCQVSGSSGTNTLTLVTQPLQNITPGMLISGTGIPTGTTVTTVSGTLPGSTITISNNLTQTITNSVATFQTTPPGNQSSQTGPWIVYDRIGDRDIITQSMIAQLYLQPVNVPAVIRGKFSEVGQRYKFLPYVAQGDLINMYYYKAWPLLFAPVPNSSPAGVGDVTTATPGTGAFNEASPVIITAATDYTYTVSYLALTPPVLGTVTNWFDTTLNVQIAPVATITAVTNLGGGLYAVTVTIPSVDIQLNAVLQTWPEGYVYATLREYYIKRHNPEDAAVYAQKFDNAWNTVEDQNNLGKWSGGHTRLTSVWQPRQYRQYNIK